MEFMISKTEIKKIIKKILGLNYKIDNSKYSTSDKSSALYHLTHENSELLESRMGIGKRKDGKQFYNDIRKIELGFNFLNSELPKYAKEEVNDIFEYDNFNSGTPMKTKPFPHCIRRVKRLLHKNNLYWYPSTSGNSIERQMIVDYLRREGFTIESDDKYDGIGVDNVVFTCSTTHAFSIILNVIAREEDVVLVTGPNYGLFAVMPERINCRVEVLNLKEEDDWLVNPKDLEEKIDEINGRLKKEFKGKSYIPKVVAFLNLNPHNPLGKVMSIKHKDLIEKIGDICLKKGVFVIDDLIYRDLTFDQNNLALPMATYKKYFNNTISLFGLSKSYGLASFRAGFIVAPLPICRGLKAEIWQNMDSIPTPQIEAIVGGFNGTNSRYKAIRKYFKPIIKEYQYRYYLLKALVEGIDSINDSKIKKKIIRDVKHYEKNDCSLLLDGIPNVTIKSGTEPESGFFAVLDFTKLKNKKYEETIHNDLDLLKCFYENGKIRMIMGSNMSWPNDDELVARVNFGIEKRAIVNNMKIINKIVRKLK